MLGLFGVSRGDFDAVLMTSVRVVLTQVVTVSCS